MFPRKRRCGCMMPCNCQQAVKEIVYPVKEDVVHKCSEETVKHIHPTHTTVVNHHLVKNEHLFPHTSSVVNTFDEMDVMGASTGPSGLGPGTGLGPGMAPGMGPGMGAGPGSQVLGAQAGWNKDQAGFCEKPGHKPKKWC